MQRFVCTDRCCFKSKFSQGRTVGLCLNYSSFPCYFDRNLATLRKFLQTHSLELYLISNWYLHLHARSMLIELSIALEITVLLTLWTLQLWIFYRLDYFPRNRDEDFFVSKKKSRSFPLLWISSYHSGLQRCPFASLSDLRESQQADLHVSRQFTSSTIFLSQSGLPGDLFSLYLPSSTVFFFRFTENVKIRR